MFLGNAKAVSVLGFVVLATFSPVVLGQGVESSAPRGLEVVLLLDSSESTRTTDPKDHRLTAAHFLLDYLEATSELLRVNHRAAVANFGGEVGAGAAPLRLVGQGRVQDAIRKELIRDTDFRPALEFALREIRAGSTGTERQTIVVLFTDGLPALNSDTLEGEALANYFKGAPIPNDPLGTRLNHLVEELHELGGELFVVAVGQKPEAAEGWRSLLPDKHYLELEATSQLASAYHQIFSSRLGFEGIQQYQLKAGEPLSIGFEPLVEHATLTFLKDSPEAELTLEPSGDQAPRRVAGGEADDLHAVYEVTSPHADDLWTTSVRGAGARLLVSQRLLPLAIQEPFSPQPAGSPLSLLLSLGETQITELPEGLRITAKVTGPGLTNPVREDLIPLDGSRFRLVTPPVTTPGLYAAHIQAHLDERILPGVARDIEIHAEPVPEIAAIDLKAPLLGEAEWQVEVIVRNADQLEPESSPWLDVTQVETGPEPVRYRTTPLGKSALNEPGLRVFSTRLPKSENKTELETTLAGTSRGGLRYVVKEIKEWGVERRWHRWYIFFLGVFLSLLVLNIPTVGERVMFNIYRLQGVAEHLLSRFQKPGGQTPYERDKIYPGNNFKRLPDHPKLRATATRIARVAESPRPHEAGEALAVLLRYNDNPFRSVGREKLIAALENRCDCASGSVELLFCLAKKGATQMF